MEGPALSMLLTSLSISGSELRKDRKKEVTHGNNFPRFSSPFAISDDFQLQCFRDFECLNYLVWHSGPPLD
jgi:hypothetical protein